jgi:hypothetical protein
MAAQALEQKDIRFTRAQVRAITGISDTQARIHLERLAALEYLLVHRGMRGQRYEYELLHDSHAQDARPHLSGLIDVAALADQENTSTTPSSRGQAGQFAGSKRPQNVPNAGLSPKPKTAASPHEYRGGEQLSAAMRELRTLRPIAAMPSYPQAVSSLAA